MGAGHDVPQRRGRELDALTVDAYGTLVELADPIPRLVDTLAERGVRRDADTVRQAFAAEGRYYRAHVGEGRDAESLLRLRTACAEVFLSAVDADLDPADFAPAYVGALRFEVIDGVVEALETARSSGLALGVVGNWDVGLVEQLEKLGLDHFFDVVVPAARKPDPGGLLLALDVLGVEPSRALHVGDEPADEQAARAAGMRFAPTPLATAVGEIS